MEQLKQLFEPVSMLGVFIIVGIIILATYAIGKFTKKK